MSADRFCLICGVSMDLHFTDDDCGGADSRARLIEAFDSITIPYRRDEVMFGEARERLEDED